VLWGGALPSGVDPHALAARSRDDKLHFVIGSRDHLATAERRAKLEAAMRAAGVATDVVVFEGGHRLDDATLEALAARHEG
jgi:predicted esterase